MKFANMVISDDVIERIIMEYPHLNWGEVGAMFYLSEVKRSKMSYVDYRQPSQMLRYDDRYIIKIDRSVAKEFGVDDEIHIFPDKDGWIMDIHVIEEDEHGKGRWF